MPKIRFDNATLKTDFYETDEGFLRGTAIVTRTGIFNYSDSNGGLIRELRHPDDVFSSISLDSMKMIPVTLEHPPEFINSENSNMYSVGMTGEDVKVDGKYVIVPFTITDACAIKKIKDGKKELSLGYEVDLVDEPGTYDSVNYDLRQTNIKYNHLSVVDKARAGKSARINMDSVDYRIQDKEIELKVEKGVHNMPTKIRLDGADYEVSQEIAEAVNKRIDGLTSKIDTLESAKDTLSGENKVLKADCDKKDSEITELKEENKKLKNDESGEIKKAVKARIELEDSANEILGEEFKCDGLKDSEIKSEIIKKKTGLDCKDFSDAEITGAYNVAMKVEDSTVKQVTGMHNNNNNNSTVVDPEKSRQQMADSYTDNWKKGE